MATRKAPAKSNTSAEELLKFYREMLLIRRFEEKAGQLYGMGLIGGFCHLYIGQEAVVVGLEAAAKEGDKRITSYRDHGHMLACGHGPQGRDGRTDGRDRGLFQGQGRLDAHVLAGEAFLRRPRHCRRAGAAGGGLAFADKYLGNDNVTFTYFGDGAANQGQVYETYNMASCGTCR
jgi:pyruvate dehydrogenase E1 component alpha subunit